jgi:hypothetical protein
VNQQCNLEFLIHRNQLREAYQSYAFEVRPAERSGDGALDWSSAFRACRVRTALSRTPKKSKAVSRWRLHRTQKFAGRTRSFSRVDCGDIIRADGGSS